MPSPFSLGDAADLTNVAIQRIWLKTSDVQKKSYYDKYFHVESGITDRVFQDSSLSGLGEAARIPEQAVVVAEAPVQGYDRSYTQVENRPLCPVMDIAYPENCGNTLT